MSLTITEARDEILTLFQTAWDANSNGTPVYYWDVPHEPPKSGDWARVSVQHQTGGDAAIGGRFFDRAGIITVQLFTIYGRGLSNADSLSKVCLDAFEGKSTSGGVWFRNARINEIGLDGKWFNTNVIVEFEYTEVK